MSKSKRVVNTILMIVILIFTSKIIGFVRDSIIAFRYGHSNIVEAYTGALALTANLFMSGGNALLVSMIPILIRLKKEPEKYKHFLGNTLVLIGILSVILEVIGYIAAPFLVGIFTKGFTGDKLQMTVSFVRVLNLSCFFILGTFFLTAFRQSNEKYTLTSLVSYPYNLIFIIVLLFGFDRMGIYGLVVLTVIGWFLQMVMLLPGLKKMGFKVSFQRQLFTPEVMEIFKTFVPIVLVTLASKINILLDNRFASMAGDGGVAAIYYANILFIAISTTAVFAVSSVMFPKFNINLNEGSTEKFETTIVNTLMSMVFALSILAVFLFAMSDNAIHIIFERGEFDSVAARSTSDMLKWYALGMVPMGLLDVTNKSFYTLRNYRVPVFTGAITVGVNLLLMELFTKNLPPYWIAITTTIALLVGFCVSLYYLNKEVKINVIKPVVKVALQAVLAMAVTGSVVMLLNHIHSTSLLQYMIQSVGVGLVGLSAYIGILIVLKEPHVLFILNHYILRKRGENHEKN